MAVKAAKEAARNAAEVENIEWIIHAWQPCVHLQYRPLGVC